MKVCAVEIPTLDTDCANGPEVVGGSSAGTVFGTMEMLRDIRQAVVHAAPYAATGRLATVSYVTVLGTHPMSVLPPMWTA